MTNKRGIRFYLGVCFIALALAACQCSYEAGPIQIWYDEQICDEAEMTPIECCAYVCESVFQAVGSQCGDNYTCEPEDKCYCCGVSGEE